jgi:hypothetical protein
MRGARRDMVSVHVMPVLAHRRTASTYPTPFPKAPGVGRADHLRVLSGIVHVIRSGLLWRDASPE